MTVNLEKLGSKRVVEKLDDFKVRSDAYVSPELFDNEIARIFEHGWVYVAHESEVASVGDYKTVTLGRQPVIVVRDESGAVKVLLNRCAHRGNLVCRLESGNTSAFRCAYHGWVYELDGNLKGVTGRNGYSREAVAGFAGLRQAAKMGVYRGLIFASVGDTDMSFEDFINPVASTIDLWAAKSPTGQMKFHRPHRFAYDGNWKFQVENTVDGYHPKYVHESGFKALSGIFEQDERTLDERNLYADFSMDRGITRSLPGGHGSLEHHVDPEGTDFGLVHLSKSDYESYHSLLEAKYGEKVTEDARISLHLFIFPNLFLMDTNIRTLVPAAVDRSFVYSQYVELDGVPEGVNGSRLADLQARLGTTGMVAPDDMEMFVAMHAAMSGSVHSWVPLSRGLESEIVDETGIRTGSYSAETPQREFWREWTKRVEGGQ